MSRESTAPTRAVRALALAYGFVCHATFLAAVGAMAASLAAGMQTGWGRLQGAARVAADGALLLQFPLLHSFLLGARGRRVLARLAPASVARTLSSTTYATVASLQLLLVFSCWSRSGVVWWRAEGASRVAWTAAFAGAWLLLGKAMSDAGLSVQTGSLGWTALLRGKAPDYGGLRTAGLFRLCRQPVYVAFALILWTVPAWSPDALAIATTWTAYAVLGPRHKEARYLSYFGERFEAYRLRVPYWLPTGPRRGASLSSGRAGGGTGSTT